MTINAEPHYGNGKICYLELPSRDIEESSSFYQAVFDWKIRRRGDGSVSFDDGVNEVSGTWRSDRKPTSEIGTLVHIMVDDIEITMKKIVERGGTIVRPLGLDAPEITAWFQDLTGNILGLYQEPQQA
jgi:predicted enzyme related to lactoylglutathione lyase